MNLDVELSTVIDLLEKLKNKQQSIVNIQNSDHHRYTPNCPGTQTLVKQQSEWMLKKKKQQQSEWELLVMRQLGFIRAIRQLQLQRELVLNIVVQIY